MDRHECRDREEDLDRAAWKRAYRGARRAAKRDRALPAGPISAAAMGCLEARQGAEFRKSAPMIVASSLRAEAAAIAALPPLVPEGKHKMWWPFAPFQAVHRSNTTVSGQTDTVGRSGGTVEGTRA